MKDWATWQGFGVNLTNHILFFQCYLLLEIRLIVQVYVHVTSKYRRFPKATAPVVAYYKEKGKLFEVERSIAESSPDAVFNKVCELFDKL